MLFSITLFVIDRNIFNMDQKIVFVKFPVVKKVTFDFYDKKHNTICLPNTRV